MGVLKSEVGTKDCGPQPNSGDSHQNEHAAETKTSVTDTVADEAKTADYDKHKQWRDDKEKNFELIQLGPAAADLVAIVRKIAVFSAQSDSRKMYSLRSSQRTLIAWGQAASAKDCNSTAH